MQVVSSSSRSVKKFPVAGRNWTAGAWCNDLVPRRVRPASDLSPDVSKLRPLRVPLSGKGIEIALVFTSK
ncbi:unnamed protein product, partial [Brenthis ino]